MQRRMFRVRELLDVGRSTTVTALSLLLCLGCVSSPTFEPAPAALPSIEVVPDRSARGLYVSDAVGAATRADRRARLVGLVQSGGFTHVTLYGLGAFFRPGADVGALRALVAELRSKGVRSISAPVGGVDRVRALEALAMRRDGVSFDAWVTEDEWWNGCAARDLDVLTLDVRRGCFSAFSGLVAVMRAAAMRLGAEGHVVRLGAYLGYPTKGEAAWLSERLDFVFLDQPGAHPESAARASAPRAAYRLERFRWFAEAGVTVWPIFYARGEVPMQPFLDHNGVVETERVFFDSLDADTVLGPIAGAIEGVQYFADDGFAVGP